MGSAHPHVAWKDVRIEEGETDGGFKFLPLEGDRNIDVGRKSEPGERKEMLVWDSRTKNVAPSEAEKGKEKDWKGWMAVWPKITRFKTITISENPIKYPIKIRYCFFLVYRYLI